MLFNSPLYPEVDYELSIKAIHQKNNGLMELVTTVSNPEDEIVTVAYTYVLKR